ncbi:ADP-ribosylglycohydrolase family protein [Nocardia sp. NPDC051570]|uniref:ADP-ribosylglycohydrolase family protein n=1 Tax=Nocardia sp. NPDC051570 TaxID=3364324 RepID=UPI0037BAC9EE
MAGKACIYGARVEDLLGGREESQGGVTVRDPRIAPKGWSTKEQGRRGLKIGFWHDDWSKRWRHRTEFRPESRMVEGSDYNLHYVDVEASLEAELDYSSRSDEITGNRPGAVGQLAVPTGAERLRGAMVSAAVGDAFARSRNLGGLKAYPWYAGGAVEVEEKLVDYLPDEDMRSSWGAQLMGYAAEGLMRALSGRRIGHEVDPVSTVQHGYQRWLYHMKSSVEKVNEWSVYGGVYARDAGEHDRPDGFVAKETEFRVHREPDPTVIEALIAFATTGIRSTPTNPRSNARGADVLVRAALAAVWSEDLSETFDLAVALAALTHPHPDDYLPAATLAVVLHQQIRDQPFLDCLAAGYGQLALRPGHEKTLAIIDNTVALVRNEWAPTQADNLRQYFPNGGADGAEALGIALYSAMVSDYVREALLLALNYATHRPQVAATTGLLIGAEYGIQAVPRVLRDPVKSTETLDTLAHDLATELRDTLTDTEWQRRYPPT